MTTNISHPKIAGMRRRRSHILRVTVAAAATLAALAFYDAAQLGTTETMLGSGSVRLMDMAIEAPLPATPPSLGAGGFAADDSSDQAQLQQQLAQQEMQQSEQQAEQQNEAAQQQALQDELQANNS